MLTADVGELLGAGESDASDDQISQIIPAKPSFRSYLELAECLDCRVRTWETGSASHR